MVVKLANAASPGNAIPPKISGGVAYAVAKLQKAARVRTSRVGMSVSPFLESGLK